MRLLTTAVSTATEPCSHWISPRWYQCSRCWTVSLCRTRTVRAQGLPTASDIYNMTYQPCQTTVVIHFINCQTISQPRCFTAAYSRVCSSATS